MATLTPGASSAKAIERSPFVLAPTGSDNAPQALSSSRRFAIGTAGDTFVVVANDSFHMAAGDSSVTATTSSVGVYPAGVYKFTLPDSCTHVALIQASGATATGSAYPG